MPLHLVRPGVACTVAVSLIAATAAIAPATARADDPLATLDAVAPLADATSVAPESIVSSVPELAPVVEQLAGADATTAPASVPDEAPAAEPVPAEPVDVEPTMSAAEPQPSADGGLISDTTPAEGDIAADTPTPSLEPVKPPAAVAPADGETPHTVSANVNVSVRIGSPGDNGSVTQVNLGSQATSADGPSAKDDGSAAAASSPNDPPGTTLGVTQDSVSAGAGEWYWNWDCLGATTGGTISPGLLEGVSLPTLWTWNWNCGTNSSEYHGETGDRYQQINANIAIRIASPGNDGPVSQVIVGAGVAVSLPGPVHGLPAPPVPAGLPTPATAVLDAVFESPAPFAAPVSGDTTAEPLPGATLVAAGGLPTAASAFAPAVHAQVTPLARALPTPAWAEPWWSAAAASDTGGAVPAAVVRRAWHAARSAAQPAAATATERGRTDAARDGRAPLPRRAPIVVTSGASAAAGGVGGGSSGSGLPALLLLPFVAVLLDLARRVALEHAALPSGHRRRAPDRPG